MSSGEKRHRSFSPATRRPSAVVSCGDVGRSRIAGDQENFEFQQEFVRKFSKKLRTVLPATCSISSPRMQSGVIVIGVVFGGDIDVRKHHKILSDEFPLASVKSTAEGEEWWLQYAKKVDVHLPTKTSLTMLLAIIVALSVIGYIYILPMLMIHLKPYL
jgi:hypothetical protein